LTSSSSSLSLLRIISGTTAGVETTAVKASLGLKEEGSRCSFGCLGSNIDITSLARGGALMLDEDNEEVDDEEDDDRGDQDPNKGPQAEGAALGCDVHKAFKILFQ